MLVDFVIPAGSQNGIKTRPRKKVDWNFSGRKSIFCISSLGRVPEGSRTDSGGSGDPPAPDFEMILRYFLAASVGILSGFVGFRRDVAGIRIQPQ